MSEQDRIAFEKWADSKGIYYSDRGMYLIVWNAATTESNKRIAELQSEVAAFEAISFVQMKQIEELQSELRALKQEVK